MDGDIDAPMYSIGPILTSVDSKGYQDRVLASRNVQSGVGDKHTNAKGYFNDRHIV